MKLQVIVRVEQIMLTIILVFCCNCDTGKYVTEGRAGITAECCTGIGIASPVDIGLGKIGGVLPVALVNQG